MDLCVCFPAKRKALGGREKLGARSWEQGLVGADLCVRPPARAMGKQQGGGSVGGDRLVARKG